MFELIHGGSFGLTVISLYGMDFFAASMIMLDICLQFSLHYLLLI